MIEAAFLLDGQSAEWDSFCDGAVNGTFLHSRRFLSYHGTRLVDRSLIVRDDGQLIAVLPLAQSPADAGTVVSHPGATYGGLVHQGKVRGLRTIEVLQACASTLRDAGYARLHYKPVPHIYHRVPAQDDLYALFRLGARRFRCDLSSSIDLACRSAPSERRRRGLKKALRSVQLHGGEDHLPALWAVLQDNLARKHDAQPVHSLDEMLDLCQRFPREIAIRTASVGDRIEAGVVLFRCGPAWHAQYIAASQAAYEVSALDAVFDAAIAEAGAAGVRWFDFGTSNEEGGQVLNDGLYRFKTEFGGGGVAYEHYEIELAR